MTATITTRPQFLNANTNVYTGWDLRKAHDNTFGPGVAEYESFRVLQTQAGANLGVDIGKTAVGLMRAWVRGSTRGAQGLYRIDNTDTTAPTADTYLAQLTDGVSFTAGDATNPRVDQVILEVLDQQHTGSSNLAQIRVLPGVATPAATLDNRSGAATLPVSCILLADVLMPISQATVVTANIRDRRAFALVGTHPPLQLAAPTLVDIVALAPSPQLTVTPLAATAGTNDNRTSAALMYVPRRIVNATRIRWKYQQGATAAATQYCIAIYDASGRLIVGTGAVTFTGAAASIQVRSETIAATTFEPGTYYVLFSIPAMTGASAVGFQSASSGIQTNGERIATPNTLVYLAASGSATAPTTILALLDANASTAALASLVPVPVISLSVG